MAALLSAPVFGFASAPPSVAQSWLGCLIREENAARSREPRLSSMIRFWPALLFFACGRPAAEKRGPASRPVPLHLPGLSENSHWLAHSLCLNRQTATAGNFSAHGT